ncbi:MAG TPA: NAD(P)/FAD-dependent oxidoreductase [Gemmatimonadales bacterium]|nr:NAD(P)/FAD-dependent oxidoreductase [Gemmatimonadales bacterium]
METVEHLIIGAGPAGLRAAQVLAEAGREVLVLEKQPEIGPKTCAGGLTLKAFRELERLGLPPGTSHRTVGHIAFTGGPSETLDPDRCVIHTIPRSQLGQWMLRWTRAAGAEVCAGTAARSIDLADRSLLSGSRRLRWRHLIGADGADSSVRRTLGLPSPREYFAAEYNIPGPRLEPLRVECDPDQLMNGYFWVFPHAGYTSIGAVAAKRLVRPPALCRYLDARLAALGVSRDGIPLEAATLEVQFRGLHFANGVHLVGDAAGIPSSLTAEGIYGALVSGEEVARTILEPRYPAPKIRRWLAVKRRHDRVARLLGRASVRRILLPALARVARQRAARGAMANWFLTG